MNETECERLIKSVKWMEPSSLISLAVLEFINVLVIVGNCLVIAAVFCSTKLRSVTNYFIVNLAVADLLVGLAVLPFSATWEVFKVWIFGDVWCRVWLAVDVWMCTASILNLCAISLDRYVAVTRPVTYPSIMSTKRAKALIAGIWVLSFVICFPPLVGWKDHKPEISSTYIRGNYTLYYATNATNSLPNSSNQHNPSIHQSNQTSSPSSVDSADSGLLSSTIDANVSPTSSSSQTPLPPPPPPPCPWKCELTNDRGYVLYSALGSFYIPMFVMLFFYWRIYRAAVRTTRAINQGFKTTKGTKAIGSRFEEQRLTLRIHRGRGSNPHDSTHSNGSAHSTSSTVGTPSPERLSRYATRRLQHHDKIKISVSYPSNENVNESGTRPVTTTATAATTVCRDNVHSKSQLTHSASGDRANNILYAVHYTNSSASSTNGNRNTTETQIFRQHPDSNCYLQVDRCMPEMIRHHAANDLETSIVQTACSRPSKKMGRRNIKAQVKRFRMETKAAKTLAIIVGMFIVCWCPFFTVYVIRPFCKDCIDPLLFSILFWLGYCNSAVNPMIYALFAKDFRFAFKRIICRCFCSRQSISLKTGSRRESDMSQARIRMRTPSMTPSAAGQSIGDDSDHQHEISELSPPPPPPPKPR